MDRLQSSAEALKTGNPVGDQNRTLVGILVLVSRQTCPGCLITKELLILPPDYNLMLIADLV